MRANTKIIFEMFDTDSKTSSQPACDQSQTDVSALKNEVADSRNYATTEVNGFYLDGSYRIAESLPRGLYSDTLSDEGGTLAEPVVLTITFSALVTSNGITLHFPPGDYPSQLNIQWYNGNNLLYETLRSPDSEVYFIRANVENYDRLVITFYGTVQPGHYVKLTGIGYGQKITFFGSNKIIKSKALQEIDLLCDEIAINTLEFTVEDKDRLFSVVSDNSVFFAVQENQKITVYTDIGGETQQIGTYYLQDITGGGITATFKAQDVIGLLDGEEDIPEGYYDTSFESFCSDILVDFNYTIDRSLKNQRIKGYLTSCSRRQALQQACFAVGAVVDTQGGDSIRFYPLTERPSQLLTASGIFAGGKVENIRPCRAISVTAHNFDTDGIDTSTVHTKVINTKAKGTVSVDDAVFVNADNVESVFERLRSYYQRRVKYKVSLPLDTLFNMGDMLMTYLENSYIKGNLSRMDINLSGGLTADITMTGYVFDNQNDTFTGEIYAGERSVL